MPSRARLLLVGVAAVTVVAAAAGVLGPSPGDGERAPNDSPPVGEAGSPDPGGAIDALDGALRGASCLARAGGSDDTGAEDGDELPSEPSHLVDAVAHHVAELRELEWEADAEVEFVSDAELAERLDAVLDDTRDDLDADERVLTALGAIPPDTDLEGLRRELLHEQVAGYYDPNGGDLVVRVPEDGTVRPLDTVTLAHELGHALADQALGLPDLEGAPYTEDPDAALAALAVVEGDATLLMQLWAGEHLSLADQLAGGLSSDVADALDAFGTIPHHLQQELLFPYTAGLAYVCERWLAAGWEAVDADYDTPPSTSLEILRPDLDGPDVRTPAEPPAPASTELMATTTWGAAPLQWLFEAPGGDRARALDDPAERAAAWGGGRISAWSTGEDRTVVGLELVDRGDGPDLCESVTDWHRAAFADHQLARTETATWFRGEGPEGETIAAVRCTGDTVLYVSAPTPAVALALLGS